MIAVPMTRGMSGAQSCDRNQYQRGRLHDEQRFGMRRRVIERNEQPQGRRELVAKEGVGDGLAHAHARFEQAALRGGPELLVEKAEVETERVI
jgi:hypothetical protein